MKEMQVITIQTRVHAPVELVWNCWTEPEHIKKWNAASQDWHTTSSENDLRIGGVKENVFIEKRRKSYVNISTLFKF